MCGLAGMVHVSRPLDEHDRRLLVAMRDALWHRGPDGEGLFVRANAGLGHRRLAIVDPRQGRQPMQTEDGTSVIVYNGEIYNHQELRKKLEGKGHRFRTSCDTEAVLHLYEEDGVDLVHKLRGMFAFAIWDIGRQSLVLARDPLGIKPLYYVYRSDGSLFFASEIKSLLAGKAIQPTIDPEGLVQYLTARGTSGTTTMFRGVRRLPAGCVLEWCDGTIQVSRYWDLPVPDASERQNDFDEGMAVDEFRRLFSEAVELRLMADVPLGMFLSGGIDSSLIATVMREHVQQPIKTFSVGFDESDANEFSYARMASRASGTDHHEVLVSADEFFQSLRRLVWHEDEPLPFVACVPLFYVSRLAAQHVKVVLTGEGSDELLGGYSRYQETLYNAFAGALYESVLPSNVRAWVRDCASRLPRGSRYSRVLHRSFLARRSSLESLYLDNYTPFPLALLKPLLSPGIANELESFDALGNAKRDLRKATAGSTLSQLLYVDGKNYLQDLLMKQDRMSMAASIESRVPFLDIRLVEFVSRLPDRMKIRRGTTKYLLRAAYADRLPPEILSRPKMGFPVPLGRWLRESHAHMLDYLLEGRTLERELFDPVAVRTLVDEHHTRRVDHADRLWALINVETWFRTFCDGEPVPAVEQRAMVATDT